MRGEQAVASPVVSTLVAGSLFVGVLAMALGTDWTEGLDGAAPRDHAHALSAVLLESAGHTRDGAGWTGDAAGADTLGRLGLREGTRGRLSHDAFENLRQAPPAVADDGLVGYEEARASLGLDRDGLDFHVRTVPALPPVEVLAGAKDPHRRVTYVGDYGRAPAAVPPHADLGVGLLSCTVSPSDPHAWRLSVPVLNGGTVATQFHVHFAVDFDGHGVPAVAQVANGLLVEPGATATLHLDVPAKPGRACTAATRVDVEVWDVASSLLALPRQALGHAEGAPAPALGDLWLDTGRTHAEPTQAVRLDYGGDLAPGQQVTLSIHPGGNTSQPPVLQVGQEVPASPARFFQVPPGTLAPGDYTVRLGVDADGRAATERLLVASAPLPPYTPLGSDPAFVPQAAVAHEVAALDALVARFCPFRSGTAAESPLAAPPEPTERCAFKGGLPGDVVPDTRRALDRDLPARLLDADGQPRFDAVDTLVVGSDVDHRAFASGTVRAALRDWVLAGGHLVVLGSSQQSPDWLQPLLAAGARSSSGGLATPDETHPLLRAPNDLHADYARRGAAWDLRAHEAHFTQVRQLDGRALLAVNAPGAHGAGNVVLTAWTPYDLGRGPGAEAAEAQRLLANLLAFGHRSLYLDYGPPLPKDPPAPATTMATLRHPLLGDVTLTVLVYVFPR